MKTSELQIFDWIEINHNQKKVKVKAVYENLIDTTSVSPLMGDEVSPIPLTPEILERNGFNEDYRYENLSYIQSCGAVTGIHINGKNGCMEEMYFKYVHELQHALRLCGLTGLSDNFKMEE